jgi:hypothetical protein
MNKFRSLGSCVNEVLVPFTNDTVNDPETPATGRVFEELSYGILGISSESRSGDANGPYIRVLAGGGTNTVVFPDPDPTDMDVGPQFGVTPLPINGARPQIDSSAKTPFRPDVSCETNDPPDLNSGQAGDPPQQMSTPALQPSSPAALNSALGELEAPLDRALALLDQKGKQGKQGANLYEQTLKQAADVLAQSYGTESP